MLGIKPRQPIDLISLPISERLSQDACSFVKHMFDVHEDRQKIDLSNENYKARMDLHQRRGI